jgi:hypothetical protein
MVHVDDRVQPGAQEIGLSAVASFHWLHRSLRSDQRITTRDSTESSKAKLQAFEPSKPESLQSQNPLVRKNDSRSKVWKFFTDD